MAYWILRRFIGFLLRRVFTIEVRGLKNVPRTGGLLVAANHQAVVDSFIIPVVIKRRFTFLAKTEYFDAPGFAGRLKRKFFSVGAVPVDRNDPNANAKIAELMLGVLKKGGVIGIHPEGTRAPDAHVYRGKAGIIETAWNAGVPVIPIALLGTRDANPPGRRLPRFGAKITVIIGEPMQFSPPWPHVPPLIDRPLASRLRRVQARELMERIAQLAGWQYVDIDARKAKEALM
jgi:1-acyl-sn-glycerol-3-phosphate acyltransferase